MEFSDISFSGLFCDSPASSERSKEARDAAVTKSDERRKPKHNLSGKRRREKIQAKLKLLRELIPNSQKLDIASLLDQSISHINALKCELQMMQEMSQFSYTNVSPYNVQFTGATLMSPFSPRFSAPVAGNVIPMPFLPPNPYCYNQLSGSVTTTMPP